MKEKILGFGTTAGSIISLVIGSFFVLFTAIVDLPSSIVNYAGVSAKILVALEGFAHNIAFYLILALLGVVSLINRFSKKPDSKIKKILLYTIIVFGFVGILGVLLNAFMDVSGQSQHYMYFGPAAEVYGYVVRFEFVLCLITFMLCAILSYRTIKGVEASKGFVTVLLISLALYGASSIVFRSVFTIEVVPNAVYLHTALALLYRPLAAYGTFAVKR